MKKTTYSEEELVHLLKQKNLSAYNYLYENYAGALLGVIDRLLKNQSVSEEILQNVFVKIWTNIASYDRSKARLYTWMVNIAIHSAIDYSKSKQGKQEKITQSIDASVQEIKVHPAMNINVIGLKDQVNLLKKDYRELIEYVYFQGFTQNETAEALSIPLGTVKTRLHAAMTELKEKLK